MPRRRQPNPWDQAAEGRIETFLSPVADAVVNPLLDALRALPPYQGTIADLGCGTGPLLPHLVERFQAIVAIDSSPAMLARARDRLRDPSGALPRHVTFRRQSLTDLRAWRERFDVAVTASSLLMPDPVQARRALTAIARSIKAGGHYLGSFPAIESVSEAYRFAYARERSAGLDHPAATRSLRAGLGAGRVDYALGWFDTGRLTQKHWSCYEIEVELVRAGFTDLRFDRMIYPPQVCFSRLQVYRGRRPPVWHHFVAARRP